VQQKSQVFDLAFFYAIALPAQRSLRGTHLLIALRKDSMAHRGQSGSTIPPGGLPRALLTDVEVTQKLCAPPEIFFGDAVFGPIMKIHCHSPPKNERRAHVETQRTAFSQSYGCGGIDYGDGLRLLVRRN
jgi:hypothetical protein